MTRSKFLVFDSKGSDPDETGLMIHVETAHQLLLASGFPDDEITAAAAHEFGLKNWKRMADEIKNRGISSGIKRLLAAKDKSEATRVCSEIEISHSDFSDFIVLSRAEKFKHSLRTFEIIPEDLKGKKLPKLVHLKKTGELHIEGDTELTEGQLKHLIQNRKNMHVHIFDLDKVWHCFYFTFGDLKGNHWTSQHLHYFSHLWTYSREKIYENLSQKRHSQTGEHIKYSLTEEKRELVIPIIGNEEK